MSRISIGVSINSIFGSINSRLHTFLFSKWCWKINKRLNFKGVHNYVKVLPESIGFCSNIEHVVIYSTNFILDDDIPPSMILCVKLKTFDFNNIKITLLMNN